MMKLFLFLLPCFVLADEPLDRIRCAELRSIKEKADRTHFNPSLSRDERLNEICRALEGMTEDIDAFLKRNSCNENNDLYMVETVKWMVNHSCSSEIRKQILQLPESLCTNNEGQMERRDSVRGDCFSDFHKYLYPRRTNDVDLSELQCQHKNVLHRCLAFNGTALALCGTGLQEYNYIIWEAAMGDVYEMRCTPNELSKVLVE